MDSGVRLDRPLLHLPALQTGVRSGVRKPIVLMLSHSCAPEFPKLQSFPHLRTAYLHLYNDLFNISKAIHSFKLKFIFKVLMFLFLLAEPLRAYSTRWRRGALARDQ